MIRRPTSLDGLLRLFLGEGAEIVLGDLDEEWPGRVAEFGEGRARRWYLRTMLSTMGTLGVQGRGMMGSRDRSSGAGWVHAFRYETRALVRTPVWSALAVGTLATGMVFATVVFSMAEAMRTDVVPFPDADRLFVIRESNGQVGAVADPTLRRLQERAEVYQAVEAWSGPIDQNLSRPDADPTVVGVARVTSGLVPLLGYGVVAGRQLVIEDEDPGRERTALISHAFWTRSFGSSPDAIGATVELNGLGYTVAGVLEEGARLPQRRQADGADLWIPVQRTADLALDPGLRYQVVAKARPAVDRADVLAAASQTMEELRRELDQWRTDPSWHMEVDPLPDLLQGDGVQAMAALGAATALLLLLGAANLVALTLARLQARSREFVVHTALGAPPSIALRRLLAQNAIVAALAAMAALGVAVWLVEVVRTANPTWIPGAAYARLGVSETVATVLAAIALSLGVAVLTSRLHPHVQHAASLLRSRGPDPKWKALGRSLVLVETALVVTLAVGAGLVVRSLSELQSIDVARAMENRMVARINLNSSTYGDSESVRGFTDQVLARMKGVPGVTAVAASTSPPFSSAGWNFVVVEGRDPSEGQLPSTEIEEVTPDYFSVLDAPVVSGRSLDRSDFGDGSEKVVVVNEALADLFDGDALDRSLNFTGGPTLRVVGVVRNSPAGSLSEAPGPRLYLADMDDAFPWTVRTRWFIVRLSDDAPSAPAMEALHTAVAEADPAIPLHPPRRLLDLRGDLLEEARFRSIMFAVLGFMALLLGAAGIYGVVSHTLGSARRETGIRLALGATRARVFSRTVAAEAAAVAAGVALGLLAAWQLGHLLAGFLFGVSPADPTVYAVTTLGVGLVAAAAIVIPAYRSATADPVASLRGE